MTTNGSDTLSNEMAITLLAGKTFPVPTIVLTGSDYTVPAASGPTAELIVRIDNDDLTTGVVGGDGTFDALMTGLDAHLSREFEKGRITGAEYAKAYIELTQAAMSNAVQFLIGRDQAYWAAVTAQKAARIAEIQTITARVELETAKANRQAIAWQATINEANYVLTKGKLANEDITYALNNYRLENVLPQEKAMLLAQTGQVTTQTSLAVSEKSVVDYRLSNLLPKEALQLSAQTTLANNQASQVTKETDILAYRLTTQMPIETLGLTAQNTVVTNTGSKLTEETAGMLYNRQEIQPAQKALLVNQAAVSLEQADLVKEQMETARAQTLDNRSDLAAVSGILGKQKLLITQQTSAYQRDSEIKAGKMFLDAFITQKTIDEATTVPTALNSTNISTVMTTIKTNNSL